MDNFPSNLHNILHSNAFLHTPRNRETGKNSNIQKVHERLGGGSTSGMPPFYTQQHFTQPPSSSKSLEITNLLSLILIHSFILSLFRCWPREETTS
jgi:hypothetical protein